MNSTLVLACSVCFGQSDSPLAQGTNMAIFFMLGVTGIMLFADDVMDSVSVHKRTV